MEIFLIRHGQTVYNKEGRIQGSQESPLTQAGEAWARLLGEYFKRTGIEFDLWYSSPQQRAVRSAGIVRDAMSSSQPQLLIHPDLREIHCGEWEGQLRHQTDPALRSRIRNEYDFPYPGGESTRDLMDRGERFFHHLIEQLKVSGNAPLRMAILAHGNLNRALTARITGLGPQFIQSSVQENTAFSRIQVDLNARSARLLSWNETPHLIGIEAPLDPS